MRVNEVLEEKFDLIREILQRYTDAGSTYPHLKNRSNTLVVNCIHNLDNFISKLERNYYKYILKNQDMSKLSNDLDKNIYISQQLLESVLPFIIAVNMNNDLNNEEHSTMDSSHNMMTYEEVQSAFNI